MFGEIGPKLRTWFSLQGAASGQSLAADNTKPLGVKWVTNLLASNNLSDVSSASSARTNLGLGSIATQSASSVAIIGGNIDGVTQGATTPMQIQGYRPINAQTGTSYTLAAGDSGNLVTLNNASAITLTVPPNSSVNFPTGAEIDIAQLGAGQVGISPGSGVTINSYNTKTHLAGQYAGGTLKQTATNTWILIGNLA